MDATVKTCVICCDPITQGQSVGSSAGEVVHLDCWLRKPLSAPLPPRPPEPGRQDRRPGVGG
jgi:hypothetical protein